jgi:hypothetical protein
MAQQKATEKSKTKNRPKAIWATALSSLTRMECNAVENFFLEAGSHFSARLSEMRQDAGGGPFSDEEIDRYVDLRDELEAFERTNRYFAIVQAAGVFERVSVRIIEVAVDAGLLARSAMYAKSGFVNARSVNDGYKQLNIALPNGDTPLLKELASRRNLILHSGGRYPLDETAKATFAPIRFLEVKDSEVIDGIRLAGRCAEHRIRQFQRQYCVQ